MRHMDHLADSIAKLSRGRKNQDVPVDDSPGEECEPVIVCVCLWICLVLTAVVWSFWWFRLVRDTGTVTRLRLGWFNGPKEEVGSKSHCRAVPVVPSPIWCASNLIFIDDVSFKL